MSGKVIKPKEEKDASKVMDDAPPGTQEYIMLRQDSIQSAELKKKESPFRAKCHEIFCCPLKQVHLKENTEPEVNLPQLLIVHRTLQTSTRDINIVPAANRDATERLMTSHGN
ncbi:melatonin-related receptor [Platysternon megacephalum]|uniref:Melatonin-related receptor n=1 Tax=Platysternon megacephalum TaxID=55544 RepID=A0A4D9EXD2_9SAUR|nr:melatonin-related receptor [Platysternon megacephalum]